MKPDSFLCSGFCLPFKKDGWEVNTSCGILEESMEKPSNPFPFDFVLLKTLPVSLPKVVK